MDIAVSEVMVPRILVVTPDDKVGYVREVMLGQKIHAVPVFDEEDRPCRCHALARSNGRTNRHAVERQRLARWAGRRHVRGPDSIPGTQYLSQVSSLEIGIVSP